MWPTKVKCLDMFNAFWGVRKEKIEEFLTKFELFLLKSLVLKSLWSHEHTCHIIKTIFQMILQKKLSRFFKIFFLWNLTDRAFSSIDQNVKEKKKKKKTRFPFKSFGLPRFLPDSSGLIEPFSMLFSIPTRFLSSDQILKFWNI